MVAITSERKPLRLPLLPDDKTYSRAVNQGRYKTSESSPISNIKAWRVLHSGYRRLLGAFPVTITAILVIIFT